MPAPTSATLDEFARLIARGFDPREASARTGYRDLRRSRARARLARPEVAAAPPPPQAPAIVAEPPAPPIRRTLTDEEWLAKYAPRTRDETAAAA